MPAPKRPAYRQNRPAYNRARTTEKHRSQVLPADPCRGVEGPPAAKAGRKPVPRADALLAAAFEASSTVSSRRFNCALEDAPGAGHPSRPAHHGKADAFIENADPTPVLGHRIGERARPLAAVGRDFAADSTGFSTCRHVRWYDAKYGTTQSARKWVELQAVCGAKTNVVTSAAVAPDGPDGPHVPALVGETAERFTAREVSADTGYSCILAREAVGPAGGTPFIAFRRPAAGRSGGPWPRSFRHVRCHREEFLRRGHKRGDVEPTFSAIKRESGGGVRGKTDAALTNEVLCEVVCHTTVCPIHEQEELGVVPEFWGDEEPADNAPRAVVRSPGIG